MPSAILFLCPQCGLGRKLPRHPGTDKVRCQECEDAFCTEGFLVDAAAWWQASDPDQVVAVLNAMNCKPSVRKWRLLACAIGQAAFDWCRNPWFRDALQLAYRWADDGDTPRGVKMCRAQLANVELPQIFGGRGGPLPWYPSYEDYIFQQTQERERFAWISLAKRCVSDDSRLESNDVTPSNRPLVSALLRELFPNPFVPLAWQPDWLTSTVRDLATHIYSTFEFGAMPILADALQDAGCDDEQILTHCRANKLHARGCWVLDAILGKA